MLIHLIRHGQVNGPAALYGRTDVPLSTEGYQSLHLATDKLLKPDRIVSSPLQRCHAFASECSHTLQVPLLTLPNLAEMDFGDWDGLPYSAESPHWPSMVNFWHNPAEHTPPNGESLAHMQNRVTQAWQSLMTLTDEQLWVFCHGGVIRLIIADILHLDWRNPYLYSQLSLAHASRTSVSIHTHDGIHHVQLSAIGIAAQQWTSTLKT